MNTWRYYRDFGGVNPDYHLPEEFFEGLKQDIDLEFAELSGEVRGEELGPGRITGEDAEKLYGVIREEEPRVVVETGVCNGVSTAVILEALEENGGGRLYSIDLPEFPDSEGDEFWEGKGGAVIPPGKEPGWLIPEYLRDRWELIQGNTLYELPRLLERLDSIELFVHDSEHSYEVMMFEFCLAWKHLADGGMLISDDVRWNDAFTDFASANSLEKMKIGQMGGVRKK
ncbi:MAG: class I SAM-dependent methyltransferase [Candidatus Aenigmatarchaeota archaeon]